MEVGKAAGYNRVSSEMLRGGAGIVASLLYQLFEKCWKNHKAIQLYDFSTPRYGTLRFDQAFQTLEENIQTRCVSSPQCVVRSRLHERREFCSP
ncbi:hypothetical protein EVAR_89315_1 [Eumeta japonica]|uniref:Uncharacterized protein n=1 Tax=Eumeta variegata TaxID=151549 RepID=A0A4C1YXC5_EUMVA|nr:hypothetical protein EVAR_89315_1 [Eumeta japonica]